MVMLKRIFLFMLVNVTVMVTISIITSALGINRYLTPYGLDYQSLAAFCLIYGFVGAFISLALSKVMAKWMMGVKVIDPNTHDPNLFQLVQTVHRLSQGAGLTKMPEVGIYESPDPNAFATGPTRSNSIVAVSTGLLSSMNKQQVEGVLAHEVAHIANGDMVTMTLLQGVVNAFVMFLARVLSFAISNFMRKDDDESPSYMTNFLLTIVLEIILMFLGMMVIAAYSRWREFRADAGGAKLAGKQSMISALQGLQRTVDQTRESTQPAVQALQISQRGSFLKFFSTHPPLEERIARLQQSQAF